MTGGQEQDSPGNAAGDGSYCAIPQRTLLAMMQLGFNEGEQRVLLAILYRVHRFQRDGGRPQPIGFGGFAALTSLDRTVVRRCVKALLARHVITVERAGHTRNVYALTPTECWRPRLATCRRSTAPTGLDGVDNPAALPALAGASRRSTAPTTRRSAAPTGRRSTAPTEKQENQVNQGVPLVALRGTQPADAGALVEKLSTARSSGSAYTPAQARELSQLATTRGWTATQLIERVKAVGVATTREELLRG